MKAFWFPYVIRLCVGLCAAGALDHSLAEPFVPESDEQVLERVGAARLDPAVRQLRELRARLNANSLDVSIATELARRCIERSRAEGDPRYLGRAEAALSHWWEDRQPPTDVLVLRATIKQSQHDFTNALVDLDRAVRLAPSNPQAWLTRATVLTVLGRYEDARPCCLALARLAPELVLITASANIAALTGQAESARQALLHALGRNTSAPVAQRLWARTVLAETCARLGRAAEAEQRYLEALALGERDVYLLGAYADFLLDSGRAREVVALLNGETRVDSLLLRLAIAESVLRPVPASFPVHVKTLQSRFEEMRLRGDSVHQREEARFTLSLLGRPEDALRLALANWDVQREPADLRIFLETALAARRPEAAAEALCFLEANHIEDDHIRQLAANLQELIR